MPLALPPGIFPPSFRRPALLREIWRGAIARRPRTGGVAPGHAQWNLCTLPDRLATLKAAPWADYPGTRQSVTADMRRRIGLG
ncbi:hypothetical protein UW163_01385 [Ralstonia solanacearum]|nr:hypothetical protein UW163_01385 [Ralstonia solanacearum]AYB61506.1 hypothetical protein C2124_13600 [Ralstonia solanacearum]OAI70753.1 hypothetical protein RSP797_13875 [Ralstonia solanacearum]